MKKTKAAIIAEYLAGGITYRQPGIKYNIPFRSICDWVLEYQGRKLSWREKMKRSRNKQTGTNEPDLSHNTAVILSCLRASLKT